MESITLEVMGVGPLIRTWRQRRRLSQLELALDAGVSTRHLSFVETGRSRPSERMVIHLAEQLEVPLRERNQLLLAAGDAPVYPRRGLAGGPVGGANPVAGGGGVGPRLPAGGAGGAGARAGAGRAGARAGGARAVPRAGGRPPVGDGGGQPRGGAAARGRRRAPA